MKTIFIIAHKTLIDGPMDYVAAYLERKKYVLLKLEHPLDIYSNRNSTFYDRSKKTIHTARKEIGLLNLVIDFFLSVKYIQASTFAIFIGANNFDTLSAIFCRRILCKKIQKIVYFASDFSESRFNNHVLDSVYYAVERIVLRSSDLVISNTKRAEKKRFQLGLKNEKSIVIPNGVYLKNPKFPLKRINKQAFIYVGAVTKEHGLYEMIDEMSSWIQELVIIGQGDDWDRVVTLCKEKKLHLTLYYKKDHEFVIDYLKKFEGIGLAPYNLQSKWTYYCSPLKVNEYISCGIPVIISTIPEIAEEVNNRKLGITYTTLSYKGLVKKIQSFDTAKFNLKAKTFYSLYKYDSLYDKITI